MTAQDLYHERRERFAARERLEHRVSVRFSWARGIAFAAFAATSLAVLIRAHSPGAWLLALMAATLTVFVVLVVVHARVVRRERHYRELVAINAEALLRLARNWRELPLPTSPREEIAVPPMARDLSLLGQASVFHLLGTAHSPLAKSALVRSLLTPSAHVRERQQAVAELAPRLDFRQDLEQATRPFELSQADCSRFLDWAESEPWLPRHRAALWGARLLTLATVGIIAAAIFTPVPGQLVLLAAAINSVYAAIFRKRLHAIFDWVGGREDEFQLYGNALASVAEANPGWSSPRLAALAGTLSPRGVSVGDWMRRLHAAVEWADARHSALLHAVLTAVLLWDFHALTRLEGWQRSVGDQARAWLEALAEFELLASFATLLDDGDGWCQPHVSAAEDRIAAEQLGHPLLSRNARVPNDVTVGPRGTFLLVTGSNMSGKSTLLRALGVNAVLAQAGAPTCATRFSMPPLRLGTSILIEDSLADGVSFFMAELLRIRSIVQDSERRDTGLPTFYLLDEILRGTNSRERRTAVQRVLGHLIASGALGAVSTHDLELVEIPELAAASQPVHFRETLHSDPTGPKMTFDYQLRPGPATTANALVLLDLVGLSESSKS
jgi:hypothetical protein